MTNAKIAWMILVLLVHLVASPALAIIHFNDGKVHNIDYEIRDRVWVDLASPNTQTTVNVLDGAWINDHLEGYSDSQINIFGGVIFDRLYVAERSHAYISGGTIWAYLFAFDQSRVDIVGDT